MTAYTKGYGTGVIESAQRILRIWALINKNKEAGITDYNYEGLEGELKIAYTEAKKGRTDLGMNEIPRGFKPRFTKEAIAFLYAQQASARSELRYNTNQGNRDLTSALESGIYPALFELQEREKIEAREKMTPEQKQRMGAIYLALGDLEAKFAERDFWGQYHRFSKEGLKRKAYFHSQEMQQKLCLYQNPLGVLIEKEKKIAKSLKRKAHREEEKARKAEANHQKT